MLNRKFYLDKIPYGRRTSQVLPYGSAVHAAMFFNIEVLYHLRSVMLYLPLFYKPGSITSKFM
jgi:hypothetical protein